MTGVAVLRQQPGVTQIETVSSRVRLRVLSEAEIEAYVATGEPMDKAGSYAIQGGASGFVEAVEGCYTNVVGLPVKRTEAMLRAVAPEWF